MSGFAPDGHDGIGLAEVHRQEWGENDTCTVAPAWSCGFRCGDRGVFRFLLSD